MKRFKQGNTMVKILKNEIRCQTFDEGKVELPFGELPNVEKEEVERQKIKYCDKTNLQGKN